MRLQFLILALICHESDGSLASINEDFTEMKNDLPMEAIEDIVSKQKEVIQILTQYTLLREQFLDIYDHEFTTPFLIRKANVAQEQDDIDIHTDVIFVGFPASAVESIRAKWFEPLTHEDPFMASIGQNSHIVTVPGDIKVRHHFHLVQISFHVADSLREYLSQLLILKEEDEEESYINAWELEEVLEGLSDVIGSTHNLKTRAISGSDDVLFILNVDLNTPAQDTKYFYRNGYSAADLNKLAADKEILDLVDKVLEAKRTTRFDLPAEVKIPLFDADRNKDSVEFLERSDREM
jgi:hypothetical protein